MLCYSTSRYCFKIRSTCYTTDILLTNVSHGVCIVAEELYLTRVCGTIEAPDAYVYAVAGTMDTVTLSQWDVTITIPEQMLYRCMCMHITNVSTFHQFLSEIGCKLNYYFCEQRTEFSTNLGMMVHNISISIMENNRGIKRFSINHKTQRNINILKL